MSRRDFFREAGRVGLRRLAEAVDCLRSADSSDKPDLPALDHDLSPELLAMEAERLGLDPLKDRGKILRMVHDALNRSGDSMSPG